MKIACSLFVSRQTPESRFSHFEGTWDELVALVQVCFYKSFPGYKNGVLLVPVPADRFRCGVVEVTEGIELKATLVTRRPSEDPYIDVVAVGGEKLAARVVEIVVYSHATLGDEATTDADFEIISVNARPTEEPEPMTPVAMARNMLERPGGSAATYTADEFARAVLYWQTRAMRG